MTPAMKNTAPARGTKSVGSSRCLHGIDLSTHPAMCCPSRRWKMRPLSQVQCPRRAGQRPPTRSASSLGPWGVASTSCSEWMSRPLSSSSKWGGCCCCCCWRGRRGPPESASRCPATSCRPRICSPGAYGKRERRVHVNCTPVKAKCSRRVATKHPELTWAGRRPSGFSRSPRRSGWP